jgi:hypothetical protein
MPSKGKCQQKNEIPLKTKKGMEYVKKAGIGTLGSRRDK